MGDLVTAAQAARAALAAYDGGPAVAVVTRLDGPGAGRRVLLLETGEVRGTIGSALLDARALALAKAALEGAEARVAMVRLDDAVEGVAANLPESRAGARESPGESANVATDEATSGSADGSEGATGTGVRLYIEAHRAPDELVIVGAGHIAVPVAQLGVMLGYRVLVLDDREEFATSERFPGAAEVRRMEFADPFRGVPIGPRTHVLLVTRAHRYDFDCLLRLLRGDAAPAYIGMIGSRRRVRAAFLALLEAGVAREKLATISAPVGLDIGAETPEEIAVAIAAELIALRRARAGVGGSALALGATEGSKRAQGSADEVEGSLDRRRVGRVSERERVLDRLVPEDQGRG